MGHYTEREVSKHLSLNPESGTLSQVAKMGNGDSLVIIPRASLAATVPLCSAPDCESPNF